jgi:preprotein translocase subunit SecY
MDSLTLIISMCTVMWYLIDNLKENIWGGLPYSRYITIAVAAVSSLAISFGFHLDLINALGLVAEITVIGQVITALTMMGGSALVSEVIEMFRRKI